MNFSYRPLLESFNGTARPGYLFTMRGDKINPRKELKRAARLIFVTRKMKRINRTLREDQTNGR